MKEGDIFLEKLREAAERCDKLELLAQLFKMPRLTPLELWLWAKEVRN